MCDLTLRFENAFSVDCHDLDNFVNGVLAAKGYNIEWRSLDTGYDGYHNGSYEDANVTVGDEIEDDIDQDFYRWLRGGVFYLDEDNRYSIALPGIGHMLQWLCNELLIPEGKYVVHLWW